MADRSNSIMIDPTVDEVWAYVTDVTNDPAWHTDILEATKTSEGPIGTGTVARQVQAGHGHLRG